MSINTLSLIVSSIAAFASISALIIAFLVRRDSFDLKKFEYFFDMESRREIFLGGLAAFGFIEKDIKNDELSIDMLIYFNTLLHTVWIGNKFGSRAKRLRLIFFFRYRFVSFEKKVEIVCKKDKKKRIFDRCSPIGRVVVSKHFKIAWDKYLKNFWSRTNYAYTAVLIEASLLNIDN